MVDGQSIKEKALLETKRIRLRLIKREDLNEILEWRKTRAAIESFFTHPVLNLDLQNKWYDNQLSDKSEINFIIEHLDTETAIGMIALVDINHMQRTCEWGRLIVGNKEYLGNQYGQEAVELLLDYGFNYLNMHKITCTALATNERVIKLYKKIGFKIEGQLRKHIFKAGKYLDVILFGMLIEEYIKREI